ncbi:MAG: hypothetical protein HY870_15520 [Chloroflexi bacterium]|nr:hypothetical protein [Chloroflexota bacterium]
MKKRLFSAIVAVVMIATVVSVAVAQTGIPGTGWWTGEQVQNVGPATANIVVTAYDKNGAATFSASQSVAAGAAFTFVPSNFAGMPAGFQGSAVVSSDQPIKAIVAVTNQLAGTLGVSGGKGVAQYQGTESVDTALYFPLAKNNRFGNSTAFYIQNAGTAAASVTAVFKMDTGGTYTHTVASVDPNKMVLINPGDAGVPSTGGVGGRDNIGSLKVTSAQPLAGTVLEYIQGQAVATVLFGTRGFTAADFGVKAYAPVVKNARANHFTGVQVQNVSAAPIDVTVTYVGSAGTCAGNTYTDSATGVAVGASKTFVQLTGSNLPANCTASATITATGNFVAIVNEQNMPSTSLAGITSSAIPDSAKTAKISAPLFKDRRSGTSTGLQIQNVGAVAATNVVVTFACKGAATFTAISTPQTIQAGGAKLFLRPSAMPAGTFTVGNPFSSNNVNCAVTVSADQPVVAIANEFADTTGAIDDTNYEGFNLVP